MSVDFEESLLNDVAIRLTQKFKVELKEGTHRPVPNLSSNLKVLNPDT